MRETETKFVFQTTARWLEEDSKWACWIHITDIKRKACFWIAVVTALAMTGGAVFAVTVSDSLADALLWGGFFLALALLCFIILGWWEASWASRKKEFLQFARIEPDTLDGPVTVILTEQGCVLQYPNVPEALVPWEDMCMIYTWSEGWDIRNRNDDYHNISLRRQNLTVGDPQALDAFLRQRARKAVKPRAIELDELKRIYKIAE